MNVIVVDDERIILMGETMMVKRVLPGATVASFQTAEEALTYAESHKIDIAFLDINLGATSGLALTGAMQAMNPKVNVIFCTGYSEYALEAFDLYSSGYLLKPITEGKLREAVSRLRYPIEDAKNEVLVQCFGNFEVFVGGEPVRFKYVKTKEVFAYLIDRKGALLTTKEIMAVLFDSDAQSSYFRNLKADLTNTLQTLGVEHILIQDRGKLGIHRELVKCDYYDYLDGNTELFHGEYMTQYSFGEETLSLLG